jgi:hypothetical protein
MLLRRASAAEFRRLLERDPEDDKTLSTDALGCSGEDLYSDGRKSAMKSVASRRSASDTIRIVEPLGSLLLARYALAGGCKKESSSEEVSYVELS